MHFQVKNFYDLISYCINLFVNRIVYYVIYPGLIVLIEFLFHIAKRDRVVFIIRLTRLPSFNKYVYLLPTLCLFFKLCGSNLFRIVQRSRKCHRKDRVYEIFIQTVWDMYICFSQYTIVKFEEKVLDVFFKVQITTTKKTTEELLFFLNPDQSAIHNFKQLYIQSSFY